MLLTTRSVLPLWGRASLRFNWGLRVPPELLADGAGGRGKGAPRAPVSKMPLLVMSKLSIEQSPARHRRGREGRQSGDGRTGWIGGRRHADVLAGEAAAGIAERGQHAAAVRRGGPPRRDPEQQQGRALAWRHHFQRRGQGGGDRAAAAAAAALQRLPREGRPWPGRRKGTRAREGGPAPHRRSPCFFFQLIGLTENDMLFSSLVLMSSFDPCNKNTFVFMMQADAVKLSKALMALLDNVDEACAAIRAVVTANLMFEIEEVDTTLLHIDNLAFDLGNLALECREAVVAEDEAKIDQDLVEDEVVAAEWDSLSTPSPPMTLEEHCKWSMDPNCLQNWYMAPNWVSFIMSDPLMAAMVPDGGQPPVLPPQVEVPVGEGTSKDPGSSSKGKKSGTKPKLSNFSNAEDNILVSCWLNVSTDPVAATGQRRSGFWGCVEAAYNSKKEHGHPTRTLRSLEGRWDFIKEQVSKFSGHLTQVRLEHRSGKGPDNEIAEAIKRYNSLEKKPFAVPTTGLF
ncbi:hypothetical protein BAE44_0023521 [Dichanthelium oligosanthes]|uniref:No apical meristem-associated C-terminal domain-containing protein n=1 Tax=Dichanthelium oligosanthes TaxID=888268 RepID=A0A1E5URD2_9POAL|nr:hypothetical protein BAE44_0023521 [Dichanthelium oligosanthes]